MFTICMEIPVINLGIPDGQNFTNGTHFYFTYKVLVLRRHGTIYLGKLKKKKQQMEHKFPVENSNWKKMDNLHRKPNFSEKLYLEISEKTCSIYFSYGKTGISK